MQIQPRHGGNHNIRSVCLKQGGIVEVNDADQTHNLPLNLMSGYMNIRQIGPIALMTSFGNGMHMVYDGSSYAYIDAPGSLSNRTAGLCGNFDGIPQNDLMGRNGKLQNSPEAFGYEWRVNNNVPPMNGDVQNPCPTSMNGRLASDLCSQLRSQAFAGCSVDPKPYIENCMYDICASKDDPTPSMCTIFSAFANECSRNGRPTQWRKAIPLCGNLISIVQNIRVSN